MTFQGGIYHVFVRGNGKMTIFFENADRMAFLAQLEKTTVRYEWLCHSYCLMNNHAHLLLETIKGNLSSGMQFLNSMYAQNLNKRKNTVGHVFQGRYKSVLIQRFSYLLELSRYIVLNPVRAGLVSDPKDWPWSSYRAIAGLEPKHGCLHDDWILQQFHENKSLAMQDYKKFVMDGIGGKNPMTEVFGQNILGNEQFIREVCKVASMTRDIEHLQKLIKIMGRPSLIEIITGSSTVSSNIPLIVNANSQYGYSITEIADFLGVHQSYLSRLIKRSGLKK
jgi:putative transposase